MCHVLSWLSFGRHTNGVQLECYTASWSKIEITCRPCLRSSRVRWPLICRENVVLRYYAVHYKYVDYGLDDRGSIPGRCKGFFPLVSVSRPALGPTQPPVQWVPELLTPGVKRGRGVMLTTHPHLVPRS
jgi:hypothetical protein